MASKPIQGPPLGNQPTPDSYLRLKQNIDALQQRATSLESSLANVQDGMNKLNKQFAEYQRLQTVKTLTP
jgi:predicted  nucleic acid-binding Zn-ribbon protein